MCNTRVYIDCTSIMIAIPLTFKRLSVYISRSNWKHIIFFGAWNIFSWYFVDKLIYIFWKFPWQILLVKYELLCYNDQNINFIWLLELRKGLNLLILTQPYFLYWFIMYFLCSPQVSLVLVLHVGLVVSKALPEVSEHLTPPQENAPAPLPLENFQKPQQ